MIIFAWRPAHRLGRVLGAYGVDPVGQNASRHQIHKISPDPEPATPTQLVALTMRVDPVPKQNLSPVHVTYSGQDSLVHEQGGDWPGGAMNPPPGKIRIGVRS
jgi:hypothetical protein